METDDLQCVAEKCALAMVDVGNNRDGSYVVSGNALVWHRRIANYGCRWCGSSNNSPFRRSGLVWAKYGPRADGFAAFRGNMQFCELRDERGRRD
jgi:hypothetical protein